jgi:two-component system nitrogen regulation response regulator NtrX
MTSLDTSLVAAVEEGAIVSDLADQIVAVDVPALRHRRLDVPLLAEHFLQEAAMARGTAPRTLGRGAASLLSALPWTGNTPELKAFVERLAAGVSHEVVELDDVLAHVTLATSHGRSDAGLTLRKAREQFERDCISAALIKHRGRMADAAQALGIQRTNLYRKIRQLKVSRSGRPTAR